MMGCRSDDAVPAVAVAVPKTSIIVLKVDHLCDGCTTRIRRTIRNIRGVEEVTMDRQKDHVTVNGTMKKEGLAEYVAKKLKKNVEVVEPEKNNGNPNACAVM